MVLLDFKVICINSQNESVLVTSPHTIPHSSVSLSDAGHSQGVDEWVDEGLGHVQQHRNLVSVHAGCSGLGGEGIEEIEDCFRDPADDES